MIRRLPADFDEASYLRLNPDVAAAGVPAGAHYLRHGANEGRRYHKYRVVETGQNPLRSMREDGAPVEVFIHIPKTAGTSLRALLIETHGSVGCAYPSAPYGRLVDMTASEREELSGQRVVIGHETIAEFRSFIGPNLRFSTVMRDPIDRVVSFYNHISDIHHARGEAPPPVVNFLGQPETINLQTRYLSGHDPAALGRDSVTVALSEISGGQLEVGFAEDMDQSIARMRIFQGAKALARRANVSGKWLTREDLTPKELARIKDQNALDLMLYEGALAQVAS